MTPHDDIAGEARVIGLRLRLGLVDLAAVERWADQAILRDDGSHIELSELCLAHRAGVKKAQERLGSLGGAPSAVDVMRSLGVVKVDAQTADELRRLADNLDPILKELDAKRALPDLLKPALNFATDFWHARIQGDGSMEKVEAEVRDLLHTVKEYAAELPGDAPHEPPPVPTPKGVSAIVVTFETGEVLFDCIRALEADPAIDEIVLVDNGNPKEILWRVDELAAGSSKLKVTGGGMNRGFAAGINLGAAQAKGSRFLIVNPDAVLQPGSIEAFEVAREGAAEPVVVGGKIYGPDGKEQRGGRRRRLTLASGAATFLGLGWLRAVNPGFLSINRNEEAAPAGPTPMEAVSGALMYLSRAGFERLGGFDEGYFLHVEDLDLCRRAEADGGTVIYTPLASALHHGGTSAAPASAVERYKAAGLRRYFSKFAETGAERAVAAVMGPAITVALLLRARLRGRL